MHAPTHQKAAIARELRVYNAWRRENERRRRNAEAMARVYAACRAADGGGTLAAE